MLAFGAKSDVARRPVVTMAVAAVALVAGSLPSFADGIVVGGCIGGRGSLNCVVRWGEAGDPYVRLIPPPGDEESRARAAERERKWRDRCRPQIAQDGYGVARYYYAAPGCEFGVTE